MLKGRRTDPAVLALYERGVKAYDTRTPSGVVEAVRTLNDAIGRDSSFAPALNALAKAYVRAFQRGIPIPDTPGHQLLQRALHAANRTLSLDDRNADAWTTHAIVTHQVDPTDLEPPLRSIRKALALDSSQALAWHVAGMLMAERDDLAGALAAWRRSVSVSPTFAQGLVFMGLAHYWRGDYDSAAVWADSAVRVDPLYLLGRQTLAVIEIERGRFSEAEDQALAGLKLAEDVEAVNSQAILAIVKARAGNRNLAMVDVLVAEVTAGSIIVTMPAHTALSLAEGHAAVGDIEKALQALGRYGMPRDRHFQLHLRCSPTFTPVEHDARFRAMLVIPRPAPGSHC